MRQHSFNEPPTGRHWPMSNSSKDVELSFLERMEEHGGMIASGAPTGAGITRSVPAGPVWLIGLRGHFDADSVQPVREQISEALAATGRPVVFDLSQLAFCDSQLLSVLLSVAVRRPVALIGCTPPMQRLLEITGTGHVLPVLPALDDAIARLGSEV
ncbi:STAS domain-containing protein [Streptomyces sp. NPDC096080]|uniref:STAS domain-containing protein n=1 Tax=Streptomyces sp. NPDC096080 TaxID=3156693 RepID=UPI0033183128